MLPTDCTILGALRAPTPAKSGFRGAVPALRCRLRESLFEAARYARKCGVQLRSERCNNSNNGNRNTRGKQAIFNRCCSGLILLEPNNKPRHGSLLAKLSPKSRIHTPSFMGLNSHKKNVIRNSSKCPQI